MIDFTRQQPHRRFNPLLNEWVLVSPHRTQRPWEGQTENNKLQKRNAYEPDCYLCPGNTRLNGETNPNYASVFVFKNDFSALLPGGERQTINGDFIKAQSVEGECRVLCFSPRHHFTIPDMLPDQISIVIETWQSQTTELKKKYKYVQIFENKGEAMGCSNPHPHCQIWAGDFLPNYPAREEEAQDDYFKNYGRPLLKDYADFELREQTRIVLQNDDWLAVVPYWAVWPFEIMLLPLSAAGDLSDLNPTRVKNLSLIIKNLLTIYDKLFQTSFPYSMGWHQSSAGKESSESLWLHAHYYPPLLRSAEVKKFMVGYEMLAESQRDILPETAAGLLRQFT